MHPVFLFAGFFFFAIANNMLGPLATNIMASTGMTLSQSGSLVSFMQMGSLTAIVVSLLILKRLRQTTVTRIGYMFSYPSRFLESHSHPVSFYCLHWYAFIGFSAFLVDSGSNAVLASDFL